MTETPAVDTTASIDEPNDTTISWRYDRVLDAVDDLGWDQSGDSAITMPDLQDGTLVVVPPGTYRYDGASWLTGSARRIGLRGLGDAREDVTIRSAPSTEGTRLLNVGGGRNIELSNLTLDWTARRDTAGACFRLLVESGLVVRDVEWVGYTPPSDVDDQRTPQPEDSAQVDEFKLFTQILDEDGVGVVRNVDVTGPSHIDGHTGGQGLVIHNDRHQGTICYESCHWANVNGDAPVYSSGYGRVVFDDVRFENCAMAGPRLGGESVVRNSRVVVDHANAHPDNTGAFTAANGIVVASQQGPNQTGTRIENTDIIMRSLESGGVPIRHHTTSGDVTVRDVRIQVDDPGVDTVTHEATYGEYDRPDDAAWHFETVSVTGEGSVDHVFGLAGRYGSTASECCVSLAYEDLCVDADCLIVDGLAGSDCATPETSSDRTPASIQHHRERDADSRSTLETAREKLATFFSQ